MAKRRNKKRMEAKYRFRRTVLLLILLGLVGAGGWYIGKSNLFSKEKDEVTRQTETSQEESSMNEEEIFQEESVPQPEPEPASAQWNLLLVSGANPLPEDFQVPELETIHDGYQVDARIAEPLRKMFTQAKEDGINLTICSAYRSVEYQKELFEKYTVNEINKGLSKEDAVAVALTYSAYPGTSDHHTGLALDIVTPEYQMLDAGFAETPAAKWLRDNSHKFGFVLRYPADKTDITKIIFEPWHFRYVGEEAATVMYENNYCLEEYLYVARNKQQNEGSNEESSEEASKSQGDKG